MDIHLPYLMSNVPSHITHKSIFIPYIQPLSWFLLLCHPSHLNFQSQPKLLSLLVPTYKKKIVLCSYLIFTPFHFYLHDFSSSPYYLTWNTIEWCVCFWKLNKNTRHVWFCVWLFLFNIILGRINHDDVCSSSLVFNCCVGFQYINI